MQNKFWILVKDGNGKPIIRDLDRLCLDYEPEPENGEEFIKVVEASALELANAELDKLKNFKPHFTGATYAMTQENFNRLIIQLESANAEIAKLKQEIEIKELINSEAGDAK